MSDGPVFAEKVDYEAAWERYYELADRRHKEGLTALQVRSIIDAALVGVRPAKGSRVAGPDDLLIRREADGSWPDWVLVGLGWELDDSHDLPAVMDGVWRERPR